MAEIVVTASRLNSLQFNVPEPINILKRKSAGHFQLRTVPEALSIVPGVFIQKTNHGGGSPFVRGLTGNQTLLLIDGIRLSNSTMRYGPNQYLNTIDVFGIEKIEILKGSGSVQYGSDAIGGAIQVFTRELTFTEKEKLSAEALTRFATHNMEKSAHTTIGFSNKKFALSAGLTWRDFGDLRGGDTTGTQTPTGYKEFDVDLKGKVLLSRNSFLTMAYQRVHQMDVPVYHKVVLENYAVNKMDPQLRQLTYLRYNRNIKGKWLKDVVLTASYQDSEEEREIQKRGSQVLRFENDKVKTVAFTGELHFSNGNIWSGSSGIEFYHDMVGSMRKDLDLTTGTSLVKRGLYPDNSIMSGLAVYSLHTFDFRYWIISAGARYNTFVIRVDDAVLGATRLSPSALVGNLALLRK
ncbi:MAG: TonB-dependent receptor plug domain-containing protein [Bacteroidetes bacterium]|nr:TonB-dependent receptor plug domain-containing protein [Bacteroidota bacterium]